MQKILILGGTKFIGRNLIETLSQNKDFQLTIFHRGICISQAVEGSLKS